MKISESPSKKRGFSMGLLNQDKNKKGAAIGAENFNNTIDVSRDVRSPNMGTIKNGSAAALAIKPPHRIPKIQ